MTRLLLTLALVLLASHAYGQTGAPTTYVLRLYVPGVTQPQAITVQASQVQCGQPRGATNTLNPTKWKWEDTANTTLDCVFDDATRLGALADGTYEGTVEAVNASGSLGETPRSPFERRRPNPPAVRTGLRVTQ